jgi:hypothetical protein
MKKKILFLILSIFIVCPFIIFAANSPTVIFEEFKKLVVSLGMALVVVGWIVAGVLYLMAAGNPEKIQTAKKAMIAAIIGTVLVVIAAAGYDVIKGLLKPILGI